MSLTDISNFIRISIPSIVNWIFIDWRKFKIKKNEIVADFGSGGRPLPRADIVIDKFLEGVTERPTKFLDTGTYIIQCDLEKLPFKEKSIDFAYSSHVVEHLPNLKQSLDEMERVSKRGYITCPSALREQVMALKMHIWFVYKNDNQLIFQRKLRPYPEFIGDFFDKLLASNKSYMWHVFEKNFNNEFFISHFWQDKIGYNIIDPSVITWKIEGETEFKEGDNLILKLREKILIFSAKIIRYCFSPHFDITSILCCPECKGTLKINENQIVCENCGKKFHHKHGRIFYFLGE